MTKEEIITFINANRDGFLATVDGDKPRVRAIGVVKADENGIIIEVSTFKNVYKQIAANPNVEYCFFNPQQRIQIRVSGTVETLDDRKLKDEIIAMRPFLKQRVKEGGYEVMGVFRLKGLAYVWSGEDESGPKKYIQL
jgi:pyridoxamine 5'-phosphate oxidase